ncbi:hypothetical protein BC833DRAFT_159147 [Globomyces pollinis-pini]|nr:hypothetical protein BC833DRAFT_159147 [Globomyces pollinis-pini]
MEGTMEKSENRVPPTIVESTLNSVYALFRYYYDFIIIFLNVLFLKGNPTIVNRGPIFNNKIVIIGDDIAAGVGDIDALLHIKGIASPLALQLRKNTRIKQTWRIYSCGVVGSTSEEWLPTSEKKNDKTTHFETVFNNPKYADAKIVIIFLGFNDERNGSLSADDTYENIVAISKVLTNMGKPVYICPVPTHADHLVSDELYGNNLRRNELLDLYTDNETRPLIFKGPQIHGLNYEYKGDFLYAPDAQHFSPRGYVKIAKDFEDLLENHMVRIEFKQFKEKLNI